MKKEKILQLVLKNIENLIDTFPDNQKIEVNEGTKLFGSQASIDSLSLVSVIVDLEMQFSDEFGFDISLTDDRAMTREISPFDSVESLADFIFEIINEKQNI